MNVNSSLYTQVSFVFVFLNCRYDYVQIRDGYGANATELARGCGTTGPGFIQSTGNVMIVKFRSDASLTRKGFKAYYKTGMMRYKTIDTLSY